MSTVTKEMMLNHEMTWSAKNVLSDVRSRLHANGINHQVEEKSIICIYALMKASQFMNPFDISYNALINENALKIDEDILYELKECVNEFAWESLIELIKRYSEEEFSLAIMIADISEGGYYATLGSTPLSIVKLANAILNINVGDEVADIGCGYGTFLYNSVLECPDASYTGYEINVKSKVISKIRCELTGVSVQITLQDAFTLLDEKDHPKFDKIFSNYPFGMKLRNLGSGIKVLDSLAKEYPDLSKATSSDWIYNALIFDLLKENGKAIGIMTNGSTWNTIDMPMRKHFIEDGRIEAVISLPGRMFNYTAIPTTMIVLSRNNKEVRLVDATKLCVQGRRSNEFSEENIADIVSALAADSEYSKKISVEELKENEYTLSLSRYQNVDITFEHAAPFESVITEITRGAPCNAKQLDEMASEEATNMQYLMLANIQDGIIDDNLPYLSNIDPRFEKYCLRDNDLILSKNGYPYKIAVVSIEDDRKILANGNLYIIRLDETKIDPYYAKAFFESEKGIALLKSITVGATIPNIGVDKLKKLNIPVPPLNEQKRIVDKYRGTMDEIAALKLKLQRATNRLHHIFDEESGE